MLKGYENICLLFRNNICWNYSFILSCLKKGFSLDKAQCVSVYTISFVCLPVLGNYGELIKICHVIMDEWTGATVDS